MLLQLATLAVLASTSLVVGQIVNPCCKLVPQDCCAVGFDSPIDGECDEICKGPPPGEMCENDQGHHMTWCAAISIIQTIQCQSPATFEPGCRASVINQYHNCLCDADYDYRSSVCACYKKYEVASDDWTQCMLTASKNFYSDAQDCFSTVPSALSACCQSAGRPEVPPETPSAPDGLWFNARQ